MPRLLIEYGTTDGQTARVCYFLASELMRLGAMVDIEEAGAGRADPARYDGIIVAGSIHAGGYQRSLVRWVREHNMVLASKPTVFISVCLGILERNPKTRADLDRILDKFSRQTGWRADRVKEVAGALKYTRYGWLKRRIMRHIAGKAGGSIDTSRDHEYTDWDDLLAFAATLFSVMTSGEPLLNAGREGPPSPRPGAPPGRARRNPASLEAGHTASGP